MSREHKNCEHCGGEFARDVRYSRAYFSRQRFCSSVCANESRKASRPHKDMRAEFERWFTRTEGCWEWTGARDKDGYGIFSFERKSLRAPKVSLQLDGRPVPDGQYACHHCDNPSCVRPDHLYPGTPAQNMADAVRRGRTRRGETNRNARLTADDVRVIRSSHERCGVLAKRFGVTHGAVSMARSRKTWTHLE